MMRYSNSVLSVSRAVRRRSLRRQRISAPKNRHSLLEALEERRMLSITDGLLDVKVGSPQVVNLPQDGTIRSAPDIARLANGNFIEVWSAQGSSSSQTGIFGRVLNTSGQPLTTEFRINPELTPGESPAVSADAQGRFIVVWYENTAAASDRIVGRAFDTFGAGGVPSLNNSIFEIDTDAQFGDAHPAVSMRNDGSFVVAWHAWQDSASSTVNYDVYARNTRWMTMRPRGSAGFISAARRARWKSW